MASDLLPNIRSEVLLFNRHYILQSQQNSLARLFCCILMETHNCRECKGRYTHTPHYSHYITYSSSCQQASECASLETCCGWSMKSVQRLPSADSWQDSLEIALAQPSSSTAEAHMTQLSRHMIYRVYLNVGCRDEWCHSG